MAGTDKPAGAEIVPLRPRTPCPICGKPSDHTHHPFCSKRCANIDLNRWLTGRYAIPAVEDESDGSEEGGNGES